MNQKKERPIATLSCQDITAILAGHKTQHRGFLDMDATTEPGDGSVQNSSTSVDCPFGMFGDRLWVQEPHARTDRQNYFTLTHYYADGRLSLDLRHDAGLLTKYDAVDMPRWASRLLLEIKSIRIEYLDDISETDAVAEGIRPIQRNRTDKVGPNHFTKSNGWFHCSRPTAAEVFKEMYAVSDDFDKYGENPRVRVIEFSVVKE